MITINGKKHKVIENLGWQNGMYVKEIETDTGSKMIVKAPGGTWVLWETKDRLAGGKTGIYTGQ